VTGSLITTWSLKYFSSALFTNHTSYAAHPVGTGGDEAGYSPPSGAEIKIGGVTASLCVRFHGIVLD
jgi:hypothetical protein